MLQYNWQTEDWPCFTYKLTHKAEENLYLYAQESSRFSSLIQETDLEVDQALLELMVLEAQKTSEIEGEILSFNDIRSSLQKQMGLPFVENCADIRAQGVAALLIDVRKSFTEQLTEEMLHKWHRHIMHDLDALYIGKWRNNPEPMQIISGPVGREKVFFEAPPSKVIPFEMSRFINWVNKISQTPGPVKAAIAHLYFESIHPYMDGNGRVGRAIVEKILSQDLGFPVLFSLSNTLMKHRKRYYELLHVNSKVSLEISSWIEFFLEMTHEAQEQSREQVRFVIEKNRFWKNHHDFVNERQKKVLHKMIEKGPIGFDGGMSAKKYMAITQCSKATATRDLSDLATRGCLTRINEKGPNTRYDIAMRPDIRASGTESFEIKQSFIKP